MSSEQSSAILPFLSRLLLRSSLTLEEQQAVLDLPVAVDQVSANVDFVGLGERLDHACLVIDGLVSRFEQTGKGDRQTTALHIAGDMADLHSVVLPKTSWRLQTLTISSIGKIPHSALVAAANRYPAVARAFWRDCAVDAAIIAIWSVSLGRRSAQARVAHMLCEMKCRIEAVGLSVTGEFLLPMTQSQFADVLGLTPVHVNRMIALLRDEACVAIKSRQVTILDWEALVRIAEFDPAYLHLEQQPEPRL